MSADIIGHIFCDVFGNSKSGVASTFVMWRFANSKLQFLHPSLPNINKNTIKQTRILFLKKITDNGLASHHKSPGFVVSETVLEHSLSEYLGFPSQFSFHQMLHSLFSNPR
jgi:uncharacterized membrane protein required for colicin V production